MAAQKFESAPHTPPARRGTRGGIALVILGAISALVAFGLLAGGGLLMWADRTQRDASGYLASPTVQLASSSYAIAATDLTVAVSEPGWHVAPDALGSVRVTATAPESRRNVFIGIASRTDVLGYLNGVAYDGLSGSAVKSGGPAYQAHAGQAPAALPTSQTFWQARVVGSGTQSLSWTVANGQWAIVLMNADASRGVAADVSVGATAPFLFALALGLLIGGAVALLIAGLLLFGGIALLRPGAPRQPLTRPTPPPAPQGALPAPPPVAAAMPAYPLRIEGHLDAAPSRWLWTVKWVLLVPHYIVLAVLSIAAFVLTVVAFVAILFTGRYPRPIFDFNVAVLRWWWRVGFYGYSALGTDRYPPFTFDAATDYPASLDVPYPEHLSRGLVLIKWWLLAIPQYIIVGALVGGATFAVHNAAYTSGYGYGGLITVLTLIAGVAVLFTARYPRGIFDLVMGLNRWVFRVLVYALLLRDEYPPFRLDAGGQEPDVATGASAPAPPAPLGRPLPRGV
ncbi:MAG: DUF4389 domain-containing protein [Candidatus Dormibacteraeota bacterium]|nr:DUF4389 domain-containing protein [Candidatus Dormibacteraeota bacterium]